MTTYNVIIDEQAFTLNEKELNDLDVVQTADNKFHLLIDGKAYQAELESADFTAKKMTILLNVNK